MKTRSLTRFMVASSIALAIPLTTFARPPMDGGCGPMHMMHGERGMFSGDGMPRFLRGLDLNEAQRDKVAAIVKAQAPAMRDKAQEAHSAHMELRTMAMSGQYDEAKARSLADSGAKAMAEMALLRARSGSEIYRVLTPEQQSQLQEKMERFKSRWMERDETRPGPRG